MKTKMTKKTKKTRIVLIKLNIILPPNNMSKKCFLVLVKKGLM